MSLLGPPDQAFTHPSTATAQERQAAENQLAEIFSCLPQIMAISEGLEKVQGGVELMDALEALAVWFLEQDRPEDAVKVFEVATCINPQDIRWVKGLAVALTAAGDHQRSLSLWQKVCERSAHDAENQLMLAQALCLSGETQAGRQSLQNWFAIWPHFEDLPVEFRQPAQHWYQWLQSTIKPPSIP